MSADLDTTDEDARNWQLLATPLGGEGSGRVRYAAAMHLQRRGLINAETLEAYRIVSKMDGEPAQHALQLFPVLLAAMDKYLALLPLPEIADVRRGIALHGQQPQRSVAPRMPAACRHIESALASMRDLRFARILRDSVPHLHWHTYDAYPVEEIGQDFMKGHAFATLIGEGAPYPADDFDLGLFVIAPGILYRDHCHKAPELYAPLTGPHGWRFRPGAEFQLKSANEPVWNPPYQPHATLVGDVPFLAIYCWTKDVAEPARVILP